MLQTDCTANLLNRTSALRIFLAALCLCVLCLTAAARQPAFTPELAAKALLEARGEVYTRARDQVLNGPPAELTALRAFLTRAGAIDAERTLGAVLTARTEQRQAAQAYDTTISECLRKPFEDIMGRPMCQLPLLTEQTWPLGIELIWKRDDLPFHWRSQRVAMIPYYAVPVDPLLVIMRELPEFGGDAATVLGRVPAAAEDQRVYPALENAYRLARTQVTPPAVSQDFGSRVVTTLGRLGTASALRSLQELDRFERELMRNRGQAPWNDDGRAEREWRETLRTKNSAYGAHDYASESGRRRIREANALHDEKEERWNNVLLWKRFDSAYETMRAKGLNAQRTPPEP